MNRELLELWPDDQAVAACMKTVAESASEAVFMAVHQPVSLERRRIGGEGTLSPCDERQFLEAFLEPTLSEGRVIAPLVGSTGTGKSHIVRWLAATLEHLPDKESRVVIRIPRGTSLKGVLDILLQRLVEPEYEPFRVKLESAHEQLDPEKTAGLLCEMLALTLADKLVAARSKLLNDPMDPNARNVVTYGKPDVLPTLLRNQSLRERHFVREPSDTAAPIRRLVEQLTQSRNPNEEDDRKHMFVSEDLDFTNVDTSDVGQAVRTAIAQLARPERRTAACKVLNDALDEAKQSILGIDPAVTDLFDAVRGKLLEQGKELILLIEDFVVLSGIQKQILQVVIKEAVRDGKQTLCTMRTVLAYTSGYLDIATVLTRAGVEYFIPQTLASEELAFNKIERLVGAYLNAARLGTDRLQEAYNREPLSTRSQRGWVPTFEPGIDESTQKIVDSFGISVDGYSLFPFNRAAIRELSRDGSQEAGQFIYNPRFVIQNVLTKVLKHRLDFEQDTFPPADLNTSSRRLSARVLDDVKSRVNPNDFERWIRFLSYWGGRPSITEEISGISARVPSAFGLDSSKLRLPMESSETPSSDTRSRAGSSTVNLVRSSTTPTAPASVVAAPVRDALETQFGEHLERWRNGYTLPQPQALQIRHLLADEVEQFISWDTDLFLPLENASKFFQSIYIPIAGGNAGNTQDSKSTMLALCTDEEARDPERNAVIALALMAVYRHRVVNKGSWDYPEADVDLPRYTALIQSFVDSTRLFVMTRYFGTPQDPIPALVQGLMIGSKVLGLDRSTRGLDFSAVQASLFTSVEDGGPWQSERSASVEKDAWNDLTAKLAAIRKRSDDKSLLSWVDHLLNLVGARQGGASGVYAIDASRLKAPIETAHKSLRLDLMIPLGGSNENERFRTSYNDLKTASKTIEKEADRLRDWRTEMIAWAGSNPDKEEMALAFKRLVEHAKNAGLAMGLEHTSLLRAVEDFRESSYKSTFDDISRISESPQRIVVLSVLGANHRPVMEVASGLRKRLDEFLAGVQNRLKAQSLQLSNDPKAEAVESLEHEVAFLLPIVKELATL